MAYLCHPVNQRLYLLSLITNNEWRIDGFMLLHWGQPFPSRTRISDLFVCSPTLVSYSITLSTAHQSILCVLLALKDHSLPLRRHLGNSLIPYFEKVPRTLIFSAFKTLNKNPKGNTGTWIAIHTVLGYSVLYE